MEKLEQFFKTETLRIDAPCGTKVKIHTDYKGSIINGSEQDKAKVAEYLEVKKTYTVLMTVIHSFKTDVYLEELGFDYCFNSVNFVEV